MRSRLLTLLLIIMTAVWISACGDNPEPYQTPSSSSEGNKTFKVSIAKTSDVSVTGKADGSSVEVIGAPIEGDEVTVKLSSKDTTTSGTGEDSGNDGMPSYGFSGAGTGCSLIR